jgi:hypothetical protein
MPHRDPKIDAYVERAAPFAKPILNPIRAAIHEGCPDVEDKGLGWGRPSFSHQGIFCVVAVLNADCSVGLWKREFLGVEFEVRLGRIASVNDLPPKPTIVVPTGLSAALARNAKARGLRGVPAQPQKGIRRGAELEVRAATTEAHPYVATGFRRVSAPSQRLWGVDVVEERHERSLS